MIVKKSKIAEFMSKIISNKFYVSIENDLNKFINEIKLYKLQNNLDVVFVDYVNKYVNKYVDHNDRDLMTNKIGKISGLFKNLAVEENLCVVLIAQANRIVDKKGEMQQLKSWKLVIFKIVQELSRIVIR